MADSKQTKTPTPPSEALNLRLDPTCYIVGNLTFIHRVPTDVLAALVNAGVLYNPENDDYDPVAGAQYLYPTSPQTDSMELIAKALLRVKYDYAVYRRPLACGDPHTYRGWHWETLSFDRYYFDSHADAVLHYLDAAGYVTEASDT